MNNIADIRNVQSPRRQVGGDKRIGTTVFEFAECAIPFGLLQRAVVKYVYDPFFFEEGAGSLYRFTMVAKNDSRPVTQGTYQPEQGIGLVFIIASNGFNP